jgi:uncharacterized protein (DUF1778 family)
MSESANHPAERAQNVRLYARLSTEAKAAIQRAAYLKGESVSSFVVRSAREAAEAVVREQTIVLSPRDSIIFAEAILQPEGPNEALQQAFRFRRELLREADNGG